MHTVLKASHEEVAALLASGKSVMVICDSQHQADEAARRFSSEYPHCGYRSHLRQVIWPDEAEAHVFFTFPEMQKGRRPSEYDAVSTTFHAQTPPQRGYRG